MTMKLYGTDNKELLNIGFIEAEGSELVIRGKIFGTMPMTAKLRPEEARAALKMLTWKTWLLVLTLCFRRSVGKP
jgi:hypothetical protein